MTSGDAATVAADAGEGESSQEAEALTEAAETGEPVEVDDAATETETLIANPDGTLTLSMTAEPTRVVDESTGELVDVDTTLESQGGNLVTAATPAEVVLDGDGDVAAAGVLAQATDDATDVTVGLSFDGELGTPDVTEDVAVYPVDATTAVRVAADDDGFVTHVVLDEAPQIEPGGGPDAEPVYRFPVNVDGAAVRLVDGALEVVAGGEVVGGSSTLRMWDSQVDRFGDPSNVVNVDAELVDGAGGQVLELRPDPGFLTDPDTEYPVTVDPEFKFGTGNDGGSGSGPDTTAATYVSSANPANTYVNDYSLRVGSSDGTSQNQSFVNFNTNSLAGQTVTDARLNLFQYAAGVCADRRVDALMATGDWGGNGARTWQNRGARVDADTRYATSAAFFASGPGGGTPACGGGAWRSIPVTAQVSTWTGMVEPRKGIYLAPPAAQATNTAFEKRFCSDDRNTGSSGPCQTNLKPSLDVTYTPYVGDQGWYSVDEHPLNDRTTLKVNHQSGNTYLAANDLNVSSVGMPVTLGRRYNSRATTSAPDGTSVPVVGQFGPQWTLSGGPDVWLEKIDQWRYVYHAPDGAVLGPFVRKANFASAGNDYREFRTPAGGLGGDLKDNNDGTFTMTFHSSQMKYVFVAKGADGDLFQTKIRDRSAFDSTPVNGNTIDYTYQSATSTKLQSVTDSAGRSYTIGYGSGATADLITTITDTNGPGTRTWSYDYADGRLTSYTDPLGNQTTYTWVDDLQNANAPQVIGTITDPANDSGETPTTTIETRDTETTRVGYSGEGVVDDAGYAYIYMVNPLSPCKSANNENLPKERTTVVDSDEPSRRDTTYCFKPRSDGSLSGSDSNMTTTVFDGTGEPRSASYSPDNQPEVLTNSSGITVNTYGDPGAGFGDQLQKSSQPKDTGSATGASTVYKYAEPDSTRGHDYLPTSVVDGNGDCTAYDYDDAGRLIKTWIGRTAQGERCDKTTGSNPVDRTGGLLYQASYNPDGTVATMSDPNAGTDGASPVAAERTVYEYWGPGDAGFVAGTKGMVKSVKRPGGDCSTGASRNLCTTYTYDGLSRTKSQTDGRGIVTRYSYDALDRTTTVLYDGATDCDDTPDNCIEYTYDPAGNLVQRDEAQGTTEWDFDPLNRQTDQRTPDGVEVAYTHNRDGDMTSLTQDLPDLDPDTVTYGYDDAGDVDTVTDSSSTNPIELTYDDDNRLDTTKFPTTPYPTFIDRGYTKSGHPSEIIVKTGATQNDQLWNYTYGWTTGQAPNKKDTNRLQSFKVSNAPASVKYYAEYDYNDRGQLYRQRIPSGADNPSGNGAVAFTYLYDNAGNLRQLTRAGNDTWFGYDQANQLCWTGPSNNPSMTAAGAPGSYSCPTTAPGTSRVVDRDRAGNSEGDPDHPIDYNPRNQAGSIDGVDQQYWDQGNDLKSTAGDTLLVNTAPGITARTIDTGSATQTVFYTRMPDGRLLGARVPGDPSATQYYVTDNDNTVTGIVGKNSTRLASYRYTPYGEASIVEGTTAATDNPFRYLSGYQNNTEQPGAYIQLGARYYNPTTGAFTQPDPKPGTLTNPLSTNSYSYGGGDPLNEPDPTGRDWWDDFGEAFGNFSSVVSITSCVLDVDPAQCTASNVVGAITEIAVDSICIRGYAASVV